MARNVQHRELTPPDFALHGAATTRTQDIGPERCYKRTMTPAQIFQVVNVLPMPIWLLWMAAPTSRWSRTVARSTWPWAILAAAYLVFIAVAIHESGGFDPGAYGSLEGVMKLFDSRWATLAGWTHYLCFDLFVARWIMNDAPDGGYWLTPILFLTLMFGPVGLLCYLAARGPLGFDR